MSSAKFVSPRINPPSVHIKDTEGIPSFQGSVVHRIETKVVGVTFEGRQEILAKLNLGEQIVLRREPSNPFDANAIRVEKRNGEQIGYLNRLLAQKLAPHFDTHGESVAGNVINLTGSSFSGYSLGVNIAFTMPDSETRTEGGKIIETTEA